MSFGRGAWLIMDYFTTCCCTTIFEFLPGRYVVLKHYGLVLFKAQFLGVME